MATLIGNVRLGPINWIHRTACLGIMNGEKDCWGKGDGTEALMLFAEYAFNRLNLHKISAGIVASNLGSVKAFEKVGFQIEGRLKNGFYVDGKYENTVIVGLTREDFDTRLRKK